MEYKTVTLGVPRFWRGKYETDAAKYWNAFYLRNGARFYKDRHWLDAVSTDGFQCLAPPTDATVIEAGCGAANAIFPLLQSNPALRVFAFDFAVSAIELVRSSSSFCADRCTAFVWDFSKDDLQCVPQSERAGLDVASSVDYALCLFVLSAVPPDRHASAVQRLSQLLKPGGQLLFRDYCIDDLAATRFKERSRLDRDYFVRQDGTLSYFFDDSVLERIMLQAGLKCVECRRIERTIVNRKEHKEMRRVWLQAVYEKPIPSS